jgi:hypothetical protein
MEGKRRLIALKAKAGKNGFEIGIPTFRDQKMVHPTLRFGALSAGQELGRAVRIRTEGAARCGGSEMKSLRFQELTTDELVQEFARLARHMGAAMLDSETGRFNRMFPGMQAIDRELRSRGRDARMALFPLLEDQDRFVRYYAAKYLLGLVPDLARRVIEDIAEVKYDALSGDAGMCLYALDQGIQTGLIRGS